MSLNKKNQWFKAEHKLKRFSKDLEKWRFIERLEIIQFQWQHSGNESVNPIIPTEGWVDGALGMSWGTIDSYLWIKPQVDIPDYWVGKKIVGSFDFGKSIPGMQVGAETLMYLNGIPYKGVDTNHSEVIMPEGFDGNGIVFRCWSGVPNETRYNDKEGAFGKHRGPLDAIHNVSELSLGILDEKVDRFYWDVVAAYESFIALKDKQPTVADRLVAALQKSYSEIDPTLKEQSFRVNLYKSAEVLRSSISDIHWETDMNFHAIGQSHIDLAWLWRTKHTREKIARTFTTALQMMEQYPDYIYMQSQPQLLAWLKEDYPDIYARIKKKILEGRFEVDGAMWLECDCNIPSGESFIRQILYGKKFLKEEFGITSTYLWMPDVFGYSWALPQILRKSGVETFCTTKMAWNKYNRMPYQTFNWRGIDGTDVLTHLIEDISYIEATAEDMVKGFEKYQDRDITQNLISPFGFGDGGGGPTVRDVELIHRFNDMPGMPGTGIGTIGGYFEELHEKVNETDCYVHTWDGELYLELHRGTLTSQAFSKKYNRQLEFKLTDLEKLDVAKSLTQTKDNPASTYGPTIEKWWKDLLLNQFHDIIPGSSIKEVYDDARKVYEAIDQGASEAIGETMSLLKTEEIGLSVYNSSGWELDSYVKVNGQWMYLEGVKPMAFSQVISSEADNDHGFTYDNQYLETPYYQVTFDNTGKITSLWDKENNREVVAENGALNRLVTYEDRPLDWNAWDVDAFYKERALDVTELEEMSFEVLDNEVGQLTLKFSHLQSIIEQKLRFYRRSRRIDFDTTVDWHEHERLLRVLNDVAVRATKATYDIQYGNCERPVARNTSWEFARFEVVAHKWMDMSEHGYGMALLNNCKYGHDVTDNTMGLTLIKSGIWPDPQADQGHHDFVYSLLPHKGDWREAQVEKESWKLNNPMVIQRGSYVNQSLFAIHGEGISVDAVKFSEDGESIILRVHEYEGGSKNFKVTSDYNMVAYTQVNLIEETAGVELVASCIEDHIKPYEILTYKVIFS